MKIILVIVFWFACVNIDYAQDIDTSINSKFNISFYSGVSKSFFGKSHFIYDKHFKVGNNPYYKICFSEDLKNNFSLSQSLTFQNFSIQNNDERVIENMAYTKYNNSVYYTGVIQKAYYNLFQTAFLFTYNLKKTNSNSILSISIGPTFNYFNLSKTLYHLRSIGTNRYSIVETSPDDYYNYSYEKYTAFYIPERFLKLGYCFTSKFEYRFKNRLSIIFEVGFDGTYNIYKNNVKNINDELYNKYYTGVGVVKNFKPRKIKEWTIFNDSLFKNIFYVEILGHGLFGSLNYERRIVKCKRGVYYHAGGFVSPYYSNLVNGIYILNKKQYKKKTEFGVNLSIVYLKNNYISGTVNFSIGRRLFFKNNTLFRYFGSINIGRELNRFSTSRVLYPFVGFSYGWCK